MIYSYLIELFFRDVQRSVSGTRGVLTELKAMIPKALSLDRMVTVALFGVPSITPLDEL